MCGSLSKPSKMPCSGYGLSAHDCKTGGKLRQIAGSVCSNCYAMKGNYNFRNVRNAHIVRLDAINRDLNQWEEDINVLIKKATKHNKYFRWHDSGDIQSDEHFQHMIWLAVRNPEVKFWVPTKEYAIARKYAGRMPANLVLRVSYPMLGEAFKRKSPYELTSSVGSGKGFKCPAPEQEGKCLDCRACWDEEVQNIDYAPH